MMKNVFCIVWLCLICLGIKSQEYPKVILPGDYPDPTIVRDGEDYYMTHSPFYYMPGFLIWHSQDLMNWEPVARVLPEYSGSAMAPDLIKYEGRFYLYYPAAGTNWVVWADDIRGPWSEPVDLKVNGIDPGHIVGEDGKRYLFVSDGNKAMPMVQLSDDGLSVVSGKKEVYSGWEFPDDWETEGLWLEAPKLIKRGDYFYLTTAEGGTAGPATSHMVVSARSKSVMGPWENSPYNPIVHTYSANENWWSKGHGTLIDDVNGNWWIVYHAYAKDSYALGRSTLIEPVKWTEDGWFCTKDEATLIKPKQQIEHGLALSDDFKGDKLGLQWTFWKEYAPRALTFSQQTLWMDAKGATPANGRLLLTTVTDKDYETQVEVNVTKSNTAGLILYYNEKAYAGVVSDGSTFTIYKDADNSLELPNRIGRKFIVRIYNRGSNVWMMVSKDGKEWVTLAENVDVAHMHHNNYGGFYALRVGLFSAGHGSAGFKNFTYQASPSVNYYLDAENGHDGNNGLSKEQAWRSMDRMKNICLMAGDSLLLRRSSIFTGVMEVCAQGRPDKRIVIDAYGDGKKPCIMAPDSSLYAVCIKNSDYVTLQNLEVVNTGTERMPGRTGVKVVCEDYGTSHHIVLNALDIHDVNGSLVKKAGGGSGIFIKSKWDSVISVFDSLTIENCVIRRCERNAIIWSAPWSRKNWHLSTNTVVRRNLIEEVPGDGIVPIGCDGALIEYNLMRKCTDLLPDGEAAAGIWPWSCDNTLIRFNEVSDHKAPWDGQGFDADYNCTNTTIEYNYSHDNDGGFILICNAGEGETDPVDNIGNRGSLVQYNVSINDAVRQRKTRVGIFSPTIHIAGPCKNTYIRNNVLHTDMKPGTDVDRKMITADSWGGYADSTFIQKNVFYASEPSAFNLTESTHNCFEGNYYLGTFEGKMEDAQGHDNSAFYHSLIKKNSQGFEALSPLFEEVEVGDGSAILRIVKREAIQRFLEKMEITLEQ